jgi:hypothetical protein
MKKFILSVVILLSGCTLVDSYLMTKYDANEYLLITQIRVSAQRFEKQCNNSSSSTGNAHAMSSLTELFASYTEQLPHNKEGAHSAKALNEIAQGLWERYNKREPVSTAFCQVKFQSIENMAQLIQNVSAKRPR